MALLPGVLAGPTSLGLQAALHPRMQGLRPSLLPPARIPHTGLQDSSVLPTQGAWLGLPAPELGRPCSCPPLWLSGQLFFSLQSLAPQPPATTAHGPALSLTMLGYCPVQLPHFDFLVQCPHSSGLTQGPPLCQPADTFSLFHSLMTHSMVCFSFLKTLLGYY